MRHGIYLRSLRVAEQIHPFLKLPLIDTVGTGRRTSAWRNLRWDDVDFQAGTIHWRAEFDEQGYEDVVPMSDTVRDAFGKPGRRSERSARRRAFPHGCPVKEVATA